jgi:hypothetical protein
METATPVQLELDLRFTAADEAFIEGFKQGYTRRAHYASNPRRKTAAVNEVFDALHRFQSSKS